MLKTTKSSITSAFGFIDNDIIGIGDGSGVSRLNKLNTLNRSSESKNWLSPKIFKFCNLKSGNLVKLSNSKATRKSKFLTSKARKIFNRLKQAFTKNQSSNTLI